MDFITKALRTNSLFLFTLVLLFLIGIGANMVLRVPGVGFTRAIALVPALVWFGLRFTPWFGGTK